MLHVQFPIQFNQRGRTATVGYERHVRDMVEQVLFTSPGERVNRPEFGCGLLQLVFEPNSEQLATAVEASVQASLQRWLGDIIDVEQLEVVSDDATLQVAVKYRITRTDETQIERFERRVSR